VELVEGCHEFVKEYVENGLKSTISAAAELASDLQVIPNFRSVKRVRHEKRHFQYEAHNEPVMAPEKKIEIEFFSTLFDTALMSIKEGFEQLHQYAETWGFLYKIGELPKKVKLMKHCSDLQLAFTIGSDADIQGAALCDELVTIQSFVKKRKNPTPLF
jgi:hypothetical protein